MSIADLLKAGVEAYQSGDLARARSALSRAVKEDPTNAAAWLWLGRALSDREQKRFCFRQAVKLDADNLAARQELENLDRAEISPLPPVQPQQTETSPAVQVVSASPVPEEESRAAVQPLPAPVAPKKNGQASNKRVIAVVGALALFFIGILIAAFWIWLGGMNRQTTTQLAVLPAATKAKSQGFTPFPPTWTPSPTATRRPTSTLIATTTPGMINADDIQNTLAARSFQEPDSDAGEGHASFVQDVKKCELLSPEDTEDTYSAIDRALCYWGISEKFERVTPDYIDLTHLGLKEIDRAIAFAPGHAGYYDLRASFYLQLDKEFTNRVDTDRINQVVLDNFQFAGQLDPNNKDYRGNAAWTLVKMGHCKEALEIFNQLMAEDANIAKHSAAFDEGMADAYACLGQYSQAIDFADQGITLGDARSCRWEKAYYLYLSGKTKEAKEILMNSYTRNDDGMYLIGIIDFEQGDIEAARADLEYGEQVTWNRHGLHSYLAGKLALQDGDRETAIAEFQDAEASLPHRQSQLLSKVRADLSKLGAKPLNPALSFTVQTTPIPTITLMPMLTPSVTPIPGTHS